MTRRRPLPHLTEERVGALLIRVRVAPRQEQRRMTIQVSSMADVEHGHRESAAFTSGAEALAWVDRWLEAVTADH